MNIEFKYLITGEVVIAGSQYCLCGRLLRGKRITKRICLPCEGKIARENALRQTEVRQRCLNKQELCSRGWTRSLIKLLGAPDHVIQKAGFSCIEHLYARERVENAERVLHINCRYLPGTMRLGRYLMRIVNDTIGPLSKGKCGILRMVLNGSAERTVAAKYKVSRQAVSRMKLAALRELEKSGVEIPAKLTRWGRHKSH